LLGGDEGVSDGDGVGIVEIVGVGEGADEGLSLG